MNKITTKQPNKQQKQRINKKKIKSNKDESTNKYDEQMSQK